MPIWLFTGVRSAPDARHQTYDVTHSDAKVAPGPLHSTTDITYCIYKHHMGYHPFWCHWYNRRLCNKSVPKLGWQVCQNSGGKCPKKRAEKCEETPCTDLLGWIATLLLILHDVKYACDISMMVMMVLVGPCVHQVTMEYLNFLFVVFTIHRAIQIYALKI